MTAGSSAYDIIAVGCSAGGFEAMRRLLKQIPGEFDIPIAVVQHRARESTLLASLLQDYTALRVCEVEDKQPIERGHVYVAPPDYHLLIDEGTFSLSTEGPVGYSRPSIDVFFESAADAYGPGVIGIVLTGANTDGSMGLRVIVSRGGQAIVQDPATAEVPVMPAGAKRMVARARVMTLDEIGHHLIELAQLSAGRQ